MIKIETAYMICKVTGKDFSEYLKAWQRLRLTSLFGTNTAENKELYNEDYPEPKNIEWVTKFDYGKSVKDIYLLDGIMDEDHNEKKDLPSPPLPAKDDFTQGISERTKRYRKQRNRESIEATELDIPKEIKFDIEDYNSKIKKETTNFEELDHGTGLCIDKFTLRLKSYHIKSDVSKQFRKGAITVNTRGYHSYINIHAELLPLDYNLGKCILGVLKFLEKAGLFNGEINKKIRSCSFHKSSIGSLLYDYFHLSEFEVAFDFDGKYKAVDLVMTSKLLKKSNIKNKGVSYYSKDYKPKVMYENGTTKSKSQKSLLIIYDRGIKAGFENDITRLEFRLSGKYIKPDRNKTQLLDLLGNPIRYIAYKHYSSIGKSLYLACKKENIFKNIVPDEIKKDSKFSLLFLIINYAFVPNK